MAILKTKIETVLLSNDNGMSVEIINIGARLKSIKFPVNGKPTEMTVGYGSPEEYLTDQFYLGATCGRVCNRIAQGKFVLDGYQYQLSQNDGENCLHGGTDNFSLRCWQIEKETVTDSSVTLSLFSKDGDQGFPGNLELSVTYQLSSDNKLTIEYSASTDSATPVNLTNHAYFNLGEQNCESLQLQMCASAFLETDDDNIPTGNIISVDGSDYNFREASIIGERQQNTIDKSLLAKNGYDHCFILDNSPYKQAKAVLTSLQNNVRLSVYTDQPTIQLYTAFYLAEPFKSYQGLCLEAQNYTDADNHQHFPSNILQPNQQYQRKVTFELSSIKCTSV